MADATRHHLDEYLPIARIGELDVFDAKGLSLFEQYCGAHVSSIVLRVRKSSRGARVASAESGASRDQYSIE